MIYNYLHEPEEVYFTAMWPFRPFSFLQNESALFSSLIKRNKQDTDVTQFIGKNDKKWPIPESYFGHHNEYSILREFVFLSYSPFAFEYTESERCNFLRSMPISSLREAYKKVQDALKEMHMEECGQNVLTCGECIKRVYPLIPQKFNEPGLFVNRTLKKWMAKKKTFIDDEPATLYRWSKESFFWIAGEHLFLAKQIWWGKFGLDILEEGGIKSPESKKVIPVVGPISFFYDDIPDLIYFFFSNTQLNKTRNSTHQHILGLTYAMKEARKTWLFDWVGRLANTIMKMDRVKDFSFLKKYSHLKNSYKDFEELFFKSQERAMKRLRVIYAREALEWMARVLAFFETSPEDALGDQSISTFLDYSTDNLIEISQALKKIDSQKDKVTIWSPFLSKKPSQSLNFQRSKARLLFIREFLQESANTINSALDVKGVVNIRGSKATTLVADLVQHVRLNPMTGKVLLLGVPGGGKGLTAKRYHELAIEEIKNNQPLLKETIEGIWKRLINILMLPRAQEYMGDQEADGDFSAEKRLFSFVKAQLQGTKWWYWDIPGDTDKADVWRCKNKASCTKISINNNAYEVKNLCETCPLRPYLNDLVEKIVPNIASNPDTELSVKFMAHYLARLLYAVYGVENEAGSKMSGNFIQILCGVLAEQGPEFISSMRRLFGTAEGVEMPMPGLFQTASYMAGTVFLDEIADAPIKIQDNLLGPLEEKKVNRLGWESIEEDVGNIRVVAATHKDIRARVKLYVESADSPSPQGFRPDLLSRLIIFPPVYPSSVTEYFLYENEEERKINRMDFVSIMLEILGPKEKALRVKYQDNDLRRRFLENLYDTVDTYFERTIGMMDFPGSKLQGIKKNLVSNITTRLFVGILEEVALAEKQAEHFAEAHNLKQNEGNNQADLPKASQAFLNARLSDILSNNLPRLLNYIVNPEV